ncbi:MAG: YqaJ viral recombinase family protein [Xanthomonadales bacterium]|nr:YqaJ viral recombinase family protein [Xanthomonadales bacterium]
MLTASEMHLIITPTLKVAKNEKTRSHMYELLAQRVTQYVEPRYVSDDMLRGKDDELAARQYYHDNHAPVTECGFVTLTTPDYTIGYSPDGLVGDDGLIECKSRRQKFQVQTFLEWHRGRSIPEDYLLQVQTGLFVTRRQWCDLVSYSGGMPTCVMRVHPDPAVHAAIELAATEFEAQIRALMVDYKSAVKGLKASERRVIQEMFV